MPGTTSKIKPRGDSARQNLKQGRTPTSQEAKLDTQKGTYNMLVTLPVFHFDTSPLNADAPSNMYLGLGASGTGLVAASNHHPTQHAAPARFESKHQLRQRRDRIVDEPAHHQQDMINTNKARR
eukprot:786557-Rhodomonas_salina.2